LKRDVWEGGHHVPFIFKWPGQVEAGSVSDEVISQVDIMATITSITGTALPADAAPDSYNLLPVLKGEPYNSPLREATVQNTNEKKWGIRQGPWFYINSPSGEHSKMPESFKKMRGYTDFDTPGILFNLESDPGQRVNLYNMYPERITAMDSLLQEYRGKGYSARQPGGAAMRPGLLKKGNNLRQNGKHGSKKL
jgi:arylsulfatase A